MAHDIYAISMSGMAIERAKLHAASLNIANANSIASSASSVYKVKHLDVQGLSFKQIVEADMMSLLNQKAQVKAQYKPEHALANDEGFIYLPEINLATEMLNLNSATRAYEANVKAFNAYKGMSSKALEIGK